MPYLFKRHWIQLDAHARQRAALRVYLSDAPDLRELLHNDGGSGIVELAAIEHVGGESELKDLLLGGIHLAVARIVGQIGRQISARGVDGRLHVARRGIDVAIQLELQRDAACRPACWWTSFR